MARASDPDSADSQFFICFKPSPFLDGQYTVFGQVVQGMEFVDNIKKGDAAPALSLSENPDILALVAASPRRPALVIGFAAETEQVITHATAKRARKRADWIVANDVSGEVMGGDANTVHLVTDSGVESWDRLPKTEVAARLAERIADALDSRPD